MRTLPLLTLIVLSLPVSAQYRVTTSVSGPAGRPVATSAGTAVAFHPSRVLVRFKHGAPHGFLPGSGNARGFANDSNLFVVDNPGGASVTDVIAAYKNNPNVQRVEPDYLVHAVATPTDPMWAQQWDMTKIAAPAAWNTQTNAGNIVVAIIDTGIDYTHLDLQANLWADPVNVNNHGFNCIGGICNPGGQDDFGHGTHVAGTIGAVANNGLGIAGLNWTVQLLSMKFLDANGSGAISDAVAAFQKILALKNSGINIRVTSNSWGGGGFSQELKDAMTAVEAAGVIDICAAGNSGVNADVSPMYPAAYDNRGIVSVLASDVNDVGAGFTNYGLASVDIAAPGVSTLSTVPTGSCALCDASGYKLLSGTSMATPHVSGVAAALLQLKPGLSAAEARDILLDPASYDALTDARAKSTSTGGRLNFAKTLVNSRMNTPIALNNFPTLTMGPNVTVNSGGAVNLSASASDPDAADVPNLRMSWDRMISTGTQWLFGYELNLLFPAPSGSSTSFVAPVIARAATVPYTAGVADNRGGGAFGMNFVTVNPSASPGNPPAGALSLSSSSIPVGATLGVTYSVSDPEGGPVYWDLWAAGLNGASGVCCYSGTTAGLTFNSPGVYRIRTQAIDRELNISDRPSAIVNVGGATGVPPLASAVFDKLSGPAPLTVNIDMSGSTDSDGTVQWYYFLCNNGFAAGTQNPKGSCTFNDPGSYWIELQIQDNSGYVDLISAYAVATSPTGGGDQTPPAVSIVTPTEGASVSGTVNLTASASDASGIAKVEYHLGTAGGTLIGSSTTGPNYTVAWNTTSVTAGAYKLYAVAFDTANNMGTSAARNVTVTAPPPPARPAARFDSPANGSNVPKKGTVTIKTSISNSPTFGVARVEISVDNSLKCSPTVGPSYTCNWNVPAPPKSYQLKAVAYDTQGVAGPAATITVNAK
jgi:subtilisin family serine protease